MITVFIAYKKNHLKYFHSIQNVKEKKTNYCYNKKKKEKKIFRTMSYQ